MSIPEVLPTPDEPSSGIYVECALCGALVANSATHAAWHAAHEEQEPI